MDWGQRESRVKLDDRAVCGCGCCVWENGLMCSWFGCPAEGDDREGCALEVASSDDSVG